MAHFLIVEARFYDHLNDLLIEGAAAALETAGHTHEVLSVPGALEIPAAVALASESGRYDGYIAIGVVIRGETYHFELVANESGAGVTRLALDYQLPIANAIITTENLEQAIARKTEKGRDAARVAVEMANLLEEI